ncbi:MAG: S8 family serine peptidase [Clostridiales bacterium]|nr:S8 family serine peptidase [Clostridiales bacterium]
MKKILGSIMLLLLLLSSFAFAEEETIIVMLEDGTVEERPISDFIDTSKMRVASLSEDLVEIAIENAKSQDGILLAESVIEMQSIGTYSSDNDAWRFEYINETDVLNEISEDLKDSTVTVAVLDTGIRSGLTDINLKEGSKNFSSDGDANNVEDIYGHGSHVAGIVGAKLSGTILGADGIDGVAPGVNILVVKVLNNEGRGTNLGVANGIEYAISQGVDVINMSLGGSTPSSTIEAKIKKALEHNIIVVSSSGNDSNLWLPGEHYNDIYVEGNSDVAIPHFVGYPAAHDGVISVGSLTKNRDINQVGVSDFSNITSTDPNHNNCVLDLVAPGNEVISYTESGISQMSGTSMASPQVAALAAIMKHKYPAMKRDDLIAVMNATAYDPDIVIPNLEKGSGQYYTREDYIGHGLINVKNAYKFSGIQSLTVEGVSDFKFDQTKDELSVVVSGDKDEVKFSGSTISGTSLKMNDDPIDNLNQTITLDTPETEVYFTAAFGGVSRIHKITIIKEQSKLDALVVKNGETVIDTTIDLSKVTQQVIIDSSINSITLLPTSENATIYIDATPANEKVIDMTTGNKTVVIEAKLKTDETVVKTYKVEFARTENKHKLSDIKVLNQSIAGFDANQTSFDLGTLSYNDVINIEAVGVANTYEYKLNNNAYHESGEINSNLLLDSNEVKIKATHSDGTVTLYTLTFKMNDGLDLKSMIVTVKNESTDKEIVFSKDSLTAELETTWTSAKINLIPEREGVTIDCKYNGYKIEIGGGYGIKPGLNKYEITVSDGTRTKEHVIEMTMPLTAVLEGIDITSSLESADIGVYRNIGAIDESTELKGIVSTTADSVNIALDFNLDVDYKVWMDGQLIRGEGYGDTNSFFYNNIILKDFPKGSHEIKVQMTKSTTDATVIEKIITLEVVDPLKLTEVIINADDNNLIEFNSNVTTYDIGVLDSIKTLIFKTAAESHPNSSVKVFIDDVEAGNSEALITLNKTYPKKIEVKIISPIVSENKVYTINLTERTISSDSSLSSLKFNGTSLDLSLTSDSSTYGLSSHHSISSGTILVVPAKYSTVKIDGVSGVQKSISLGYGNNNFAIEVTAEDGTKKTYTLTVNRQAAPIPKSKPDSGASTGGSPGGATGGFVFIPPSPPGTEPIVPKDTVKSVRRPDGTVTKGIEVNKDRIEGIIADKEQDNISVNTESEDITEVIIDKEVLKSIQRSEKPLKVNYGKVSFIMNKEVLESLGEEALTVSVETVDFSDRFLVSEVYEMDILSNNKKAEITIPVPIVLTYDQESIKNKDHLAVFYYDELKKEWVYVGGKIITDGQITFEAKHFSKYAIRENSKTFDDIQAHWAKEAIESLASREITSGINAFEFAPDKTLTNAEFVVLLSKVLNLEEAKTAAQFVNISKDDWYAPFFDNAAEAGLLINTYSINFEPNEPIKREEMASLLIDAYSYYLKKDKAELVKAHDEFSADAALVSAHFADSVKMTYELQLIVGDTHNNFNPKDGATRAEAAVVIRKLLILLELL